MVVHGLLAPGAAPRRILPVLRRAIAWCNPPKRLDSTLIYTFELRSAGTCRRYFPIWLSRLFHGISVTLAARQHSDAERRKTHIDPPPRKQNRALAQL